MGKFSDIRKNKKWRMGIIGGLAVIVVLLIIFWKKGTIWLYAILVMLLVALGVEGFDYDIDLGKFLQTGSYEESRVQTIQDKNGNSVRLIGDCVKADVNCDNFQTQADAQKVYDTCMQEIAKNNKNIENPVNLDIYGLDKDKDGLACEALPKFAQ